MSDFASEAELQTLIEEAIRNETLAELVVDDALLIEAAANEDKDRLPHFSLDRLCRHAAITAGASVLESLGSLTLLRANKNVSLTQGETLKPDVVCFNPETESVVLFELKVSTAAGRQAITELAAYEQEIKNHLPLLSEHDVHLVLVASEWSVLMDHGASSAVTWGGKKILCLQAEKAQGKLVLKTRIPEAWQITGSAKFPPEALATMTLCLYDYQQDTDPRKEPEFDPRLLTAMKVMGRTGDALGSHGFAILWKDHAPYSLAPFNVTICCVAPFSLYREGRSSGVIESNGDSFVAALDELMRDAPPTGQSGTFFAIGQSAFPLLSELFTPQWEAASHWKHDRATLMTRAEPLMCEFWGSLGRHAIDYVSSPTLRRERPNLLLGNLADWNSPSVAIPLIDQMCEPRVLASGNVRWKDAFRLGFFLGLDRSLRQTIRLRPDDGFLRCRHLWNTMDVQYALEEVQLLSNSAANVNPPDSALTFQNNPDIDDEDEFVRLVRWIMDEFLMKEPGHVNAFLCGLEGAPLFDEEGLGKVLAEESGQIILTRIDAPLRGATAAVLRGLIAQFKEGSLPPHAGRLLEQLRTELQLPAADTRFDLASVPAKLLQSAWPCCLDASDYVVHGVLHRLNAADFAGVDWDWLRQGVMEAHGRGETNVGVILSANGYLGTGPIEPGGFKLPLRMCDPAIEVAFLDETAVATMVRIVTWDELQELKTYASFSQPSRENSED